MLLRRLLRGLVAVLALVCFALLGLTFAGACYEPNTEIPAGFLGRKLVVNGLPLRVLQAGSGRDVLLIHGSPGSLEDWAPVLDALSGSFRVTAFDRPGNGFSGDTGRYSFEHNAEIALSVIEALKLEHVVVVGHSYGGSTALALALHGSPQVDAYVIVDSAAYSPSRRTSALSRLLAVPWLGTGFARTLGSRTTSRIRQGIVEQFNGRTPPEDFIALRTRIWSTPKVAHTFASELESAHAEFPALSARYPGIRHPVHILAQADHAFRRANAERLHREVSGSTLRLVPGTGHYIQFERPEEVIAAIKKAAGT